MKNVTLHRTTILQFDVDATDSALDAAADCDVLRNNAALDLCAIADQKLRGAQLAFDSAKDLRWTRAFDLANDRHARADARVRSRFRYWRPRHDRFNDRVLLLHHPSDDFGRIRCRVLILLGCLAFEPTQHVHLRFPRHAVQKGPRLSCRASRHRAFDSHRVEDSQVRTPFENRTAQTRTATTMEPTIASHSVYGVVSGISFPNDPRIAPPIRISLYHLPVRFL